MPSEFGEVRSAAPDEAAEIMKMARSVVIVPGYGMAVAQAQHKVRELADALEKEGVEVRFAIHPVAGRMPGHMNVLLAEANVPYDQLLDMDEINADFPQTDVVLVVGANDVVNPAARHDTGSPIYGMPILEVDKAACVIVVKRSMRAGLRRHRERALLRPEDADGVRRRQGRGDRAHQRGQRRPGRDQPVGTVVGIALAAGPHGKVRSRGPPLPTSEPPR